MRLLARQDIWADDGIRYLLSPEQRRAFLQRYAQTNRELAEQYFPELQGELFALAENEDRDWFPVSLPSEEECEALSAAFGAIILAHTQSAPLKV